MMTKCIDQKQWEICVPIKYIKIQLSHVKEKEKESDMK